MASYTGVVQPLSRAPLIGELFPLVDPRRQLTVSREVARMTWEIMAAELVGTDEAVGTDDYTFHLGKVRRDSYLAAFWVVAPEGVEENAEDYLDLGVYFNLAQKTHGRNTVYGLLPQLPEELLPAGNMVIRQVQKGDTIELFIVGVGAGQPIPHGLKVYACLLWR